MGIDQVAPDPDADGQIGDDDGLKDTVETNDAGDGAGKESRDGLGPEKNAQILKFLNGIAHGESNAGNVLDIINLEPNKELACEVVLGTINHWTDNDSRRQVMDAIASKAIEYPEFAPAMVALITYTYRHNLQGARFWMNPSNKETLFVDDDGQLISFEGEIGTIQKGLQGEGTDYIAKLGRYQVLSGLNRGKIFRGDLPPGQPDARPIRGPKMPV